MRLHRLNDPNWTIFKMIFIIYSIWKLSTYTWNDCMRIELNGIERNGNRYTECEWERNIERERLKQKIQYLGFWVATIRLARLIIKKWFGEEKTLFSSSIWDPQMCRWWRSKWGMDERLRAMKEWGLRDSVHPNWKDTIGPNSILDAPRSAKIPVDLT